MKKKKIKKIACLHNISLHAWISHPPTTRCSPFEPAYASVVRDVAEVVVGVVADVP